MGIITRSEALSQGLPRYFTGKPCKEGHIAERQVSNWTCFECSRQKDRDRAGTDLRLASRKAAHWRSIEKNRARDRARANAPQRVDARRRYREENRERWNASSVAYTLGRLKVDPIYRLQRYMRGRLRKAVKAQGVVKSGRTNQIIGCNAYELKDWLEAQFTEGMSWDNYGYYGWHVDHIRPCASFDLTDPEQQRQCFHYTNLQPLWGQENRAKSDSLDWQRDMAG